MSAPLKIVFFGTSEFAVPALEALQRVHSIVHVVTQPDRPAGRGKQLMSTPVRRSADALQLPVWTPEKLRAEVATLAAIEADAYVVVSYGQILPAEILALPKYGAFNIHPSALPLYRGANPLAAPIRDGRTQTALSIIQMDAGMDTGDVVLQEPTPIGVAETGSALHDRMAQWGAAAIVDVLAQIANGTLIRRPQSDFSIAADEIAATRTRPVRGDDLLIDWQKSAAEITALVRAYADVPAARTQLCGERVKVLAARVHGDAQNPARPGEITEIHGDAAVVACGDGSFVALTSIIPPGRSRQSGAEFARRFRKTLP